MGVVLNRNLALRVASSFAALPIVLWPVFNGGAPFLLLLLACAFLMLSEWLKMISAHYFPVLMVCGVVIAVLVAGFFQMTLDKNLLSPNVFALLMSCIFILVLSGVYFGRTSSKLIFIAIGIGYIILATGSLFYLRSLSGGFNLVVWLLFSVWATDVGGYFAGKAIGGAKLAPRISPNKTWSGFSGGIVLASVIGASISLITDWWRPDLAALGSAIVAIIAQIGDLYESRLKRQFNIKDSGGVIPGHGGLLDRVDGLVFAAGAAAILMALGHPAG